MEYFAILTAALPNGRSISMTRVITVTPATTRSDLYQHMRREVIRTYDCDPEHGRVTWFSAEPNSLIYRQ